MTPLLAALAAVPARATGLVVAFSGGRDSTALLNALSFHAPRELPLRAIHVCHHLLAQADAWADHCEAQCRRWRVPFTRRDVVVVDTGQGLEAAARQARYAALADALQEGELLVTGHHARDQAETFLLQALRGAGLKGLSAMPVYADFGRGAHWRPWLSIDIGEIETFTREHALDWIEDPSNADPAIDRNYLRLRVLPALESRWPAFAKTLARSAAHAAPAAARVQANAYHDLDEVRDAQGALGCQLLRAFSETRRSELLRAWLASEGHDRPDHRHLGQIARLLHARMTASPCVHFADTDVRLFDGRLFCMTHLAALPDATSLTWNPAQALALAPGCGRLEMTVEGTVVRPLTVTYRRGGERLESGHTTHELKEWLRVARIPPWIRERMPLVYAGDTLVAVAHYWRHRRIDDVLGAHVAAIHWQHALAGEPERVVGDRPFG